MSSPSQEHPDVPTILREFGSRPLTTKERLSIPPIPMPEQDPNIRRRSMGEVALGYSDDEARVEALRCLQCKNAPCVKSCPVNIDIPAFITHIANGNPDEALSIIQRTNLLPAVCGRVCPQETQCQLTCTVGKSHKDLCKSVNIGRLERYAADRERMAGKFHLPACKPYSGKQVAVVGSGPASLAAAADLAREGHRVTIFEAFHKPGGVMIYGIPEFRLPKEIVAREIDMLKAMGVEIRTNFLVGRTRKLRDLLEKDGYAAVFIGSGAGLPKFMNIEGEDLVGVFSANEYLTRANLMKAYEVGKAHTPFYAAKTVAVLGGGNVAMDAARTALRMGAETAHIIYRRTEHEMPARMEEVHHAQQEGITFHFLRNARRILGTEQRRVNGIELISYELGEPDASGRRSPVEVKDSSEILPVDAVIVAIGNDSNPLLAQTTPELKLNDKGNILVDENGKTSMDKVYAGGDIVLGAATVILAMGEGRKAAASIHAMLSAK